MSLAEIADWAVSSPLIDGVVFVPAEEGPETLPVRAVALAAGFTGHGKGLTQSEALASAVGEALEQFAASRIYGKALIEESFASLVDRSRQEVFDPRWLCLYHPDQYQSPGFPYRPFNPHMPLHWISGRWLDSSESVYLPAFAVFLSRELAPEALCQMTSNGLAAGESVQEAAGNAALELYERDAFIASWVAQCNAVPLRMTDVDTAVAEMIDQCELNGAKIEIYLVAQGKPAYVAVCVGLGDGYRWPPVTLGLGAGSELRQAVKRAVLEHGQTGPCLAARWRRKQMTIPAAHRDVRTLFDQASYYCDPAHFPEFENWRTAEHYIDSIPSCDSDVRIATVDLTPPELEDSPYRVVRAVARGLQPVYAGYGFERVHTRRLRHLLERREPNLAPLPVC